MMPTPPPLPSLEEACYSAILHFGRTCRAVVRQRLPARVRTALLRRIVLEGRVTSLTPALAAWPHHTLPLGALCCSEPRLFYHTASLRPEDTLPQLVWQAAQACRAGLLAYDDASCYPAALSVVFVCARFIETLLQEPEMQLRHLDLTQYAFCALEEFVLVMDAMLALYERDMRCGYEPPDGAHFTLSVSLAYKPTSVSANRPLQLAVEKLQQLLQLQQLRNTRVRLQVAGAVVEAADQRDVTKFLQMLADWDCGLKLLLIEGPEDIRRPENVALLTRFPKLSVLGPGTPRWLQRPRPRNRPAPAPPVAALPDALAPQSLLLADCGATAAAELLERCWGADTPGMAGFRSLSMSASLLQWLSPRQLSLVRRLCVGPDNSGAATDPGRLLRAHRQMNRLCQLLTSCQLLETLHVTAHMRQEHVQPLMTALRSMPQLRFLHVTLSVDEPAWSLLPLCVALRRLPHLLAAHVSIVESWPPAAAPDADDLWPRPMTLRTLASGLRRALGPPRREEVYTHLSLRRPTGGGQVQIFSDLTPL